MQSIIASKEAMLNREESIIRRSVDNGIKIVIIIVTAISNSIMIRNLVSLNGILYSSLT